MADIDKAFIFTIADKDDSSWLQDKMDKFESSILPNENIQDINLIVKNSNGEKIGGIIANTRYSTVYINALWVMDKYRKKGIGKELVTFVEKRAKEYGCLYSSLGTFDAFNTKEFYKKLGYAVISTSIDSPIGYIGYWFTKKL